MFKIKSNSRYEIQNILTNDTRIIFNKGSKNQIIIDKKLCRSSFDEYLSLTNRLIELGSNFFIHHSELLHTLEASIKMEISRSPLNRRYDNRIWKMIVNNYIRSSKTSLLAVNFFYGLYIISIINMFFIVDN